MIKYSIIHEVDKYEVLYLSALRTLQFYHFNISNMIVRAINTWSGTWDRWSWCS